MRRFFCECKSMSISELKYVIEGLWRVEEGEFVQCILPWGRGRENTRQTLSQELMTSAPLGDRGFRSQDDPRRSDWKTSNQELRLYMRDMCKSAVRPLLLTTYSLLFGLCTFGNPLLICYLGVINCASVCKVVEGRPCTISSKNVIHWYLAGWAPSN